MFIFVDNSSSSQQEHFITWPQVQRPISKDIRRHRHQPLIIQRPQWSQVVTIITGNGRLRPPKMAFSWPIRIMVSKTTPNIPRPPHRPPMGITNWFNMKSYILLWIISMRFWNFLEGEPLVKWQNVGRRAQMKLWLSKSWKIILLMQGMCITIYITRFLFPPSSLAFKKRCKTVIFSLDQIIF